MPKHEELTLKGYLTNNPIFSDKLAKADMKVYFGNVDVDIHAIFWSKAIQGKLRKYARGNKICVKGYFAPRKFGSIGEREFHVEQIF